MAQVELFPLKHVEKPMQKNYTRNLVNRKEDHNETRLVQEKVANGEIKIMVFIRTKVFKKISCKLYPQFNQRTMQTSFARVSFDMFRSTGKKF